MCIYTYISVPAVRARHVSVHKSEARLHNTSNIRETEFGTRPAQKSTVCDGKRHGSTKSGRAGSGIATSHPR